LNSEETYSVNIIGNDWRIGHRVLFRDLAGRLSGFLRLARRGKPDRGLGRQLEERKKFAFNKEGLSKNKTKSPEGEKIPREQTLENQEPEAFERKRAL